MNSSMNFPLNNYTTLKITNRTRDTKRQKRLAKDNIPAEKLYTDDDVAMMYSTSSMTTSNFHNLVDNHYKLPILKPTKGQLMVRLSSRVCLNFWPSSGALDLSGSVAAREEHVSFLKALLENKGAGVNNMIACANLKPNTQSIL
jgi:hypothetical protein